MIHKGALQYVCTLEKQVFVRIVQFKVVLRRVLRRKENFVAKIVSNSQMLPLIKRCHYINVFPTDLQVAGDAMRGEMAKIFLFRTFFVYCNNYCILHHQF